MRFVGTNIPLYAISSRPAEAAKAERAVALLNAPDLALSVQVLPEFYVQATRSTAASPLSHDAAVAFIDTLRRFPVQEITVPLMQVTLAARARWGISYWDATNARCKLLWKPRPSHPNAKLATKPSRIPGKHENTRKEDKKTAIARFQQVARMYQK
ncbi:MAG: hypothetical protein ACREXW_13375 [Gammaproteobacteria bacterium]